MSFEPLFTVGNAITDRLARIERARGFLEAATLSEDWIRRMSERALLLEARHTTHIEGTHLSLDDSERLLAGEGVPGADLSERQGFALGHVLKYGRLSIQDYERLCSGIARRTLQRDLRVLAEKGLFKEAGTSPTDPARHYVLADRAAEPGRRQLAPERLRQCYASAWW